MRHSTHHSSEVLGLEEANKSHHHDKIKPFAKILIALECPYSTFVYNYRYLLGTKGSFLVGMDPDQWTYFTNITVFLCSILAVGLGILTDSYWAKYYVLLSGFGFSIISSIIVFITNVANVGKIKTILNTIGLIWMCSYQVIEPIRVGLFFDQLPKEMESHQAGHVFLMYQEMKTLGSIMYVAMNRFLGSKVYGDVPLSQAIIYALIPIVYTAVITSFYKAYNPGEFSYELGVDCITCFVHAIHQKFTDKTPNETGHWLDVARSAYDSRTVRTAKNMSTLTFIYFSLLSYGMTAMLLKNTWSDQTKNLIEDLHIKKYYVDVNIIYFALTIIFLPIIEYFLLPTWSKYKKPLTELQRIGITVFLTGISFIATTVVQLEIEKYSSLLPSSSFAQVRIFNASPLEVTFTAEWNFAPVQIPPLGMIEAWNVKPKQTSLLNFQITGSNISYRGIMYTAEGESISYIVGKEELKKIDGYDPILFGPPGTNLPDKVRIYIINYSSFNDDFPLLEVGRAIKFSNPEYTVTAITPGLGKKYIFQVYPGDYRISCPTYELRQCSNSTILSLKTGGLYAILPYVRDGEVILKEFTILAPAAYSVYIMIPQIALLSFAEAMGKIPINLFIFKESPLETRSMSLALYYFSRDGTSIVFAAFSNVFRFRVDSFQLVLVTGIHMVFCFVFIYSALRHQKYPEEEGSSRRRGIFEPT